jgi:ABC-type lipoprotein release transport system permease subunit
LHWGQGRIGIEGRSLYAPHGLLPSPAGVAGRTTEIRESGGILVGVPLSVIGAKLIEPLLFGVSSTDAAALTISALLLAGAGTLAAFWPARRAAGLNPFEALRDR